MKTIFWRKFFWKWTFLFLYLFCAAPLILSIGYFSVKTVFHGKQFCFLQCFLISFLTYHVYTIVSINICEKNLSCSFFVKFFLPSESCFSFFPVYPIVTIIRIVSCENVCSRKISFFSMLFQCLDLVSPSIRSSG